MHFEKSDTDYFGDGASNHNFLKIISQKSFWDISNQKYFQDLK